MIRKVSSSSSVDDFPLKHRTFKRMPKLEALSMFSLAGECSIRNVLG